MTVIELRFPAGGRLHATPWGRHVNEGATEWPPSPWRIQRALVATWYLKAREIEEGTMRLLMESLASAPPSFQLPAAVQSHTRHYMPGRGTEKPKIFDTFVQSSRPVRIGWAVELNEAEREALGILCQRLGYLGRAESIVEAELLSAGEDRFQPNSWPLPSDQNLPDKTELVGVLCASTAREHRDWRQSSQQTVDAAKPGKKNKPGKSKAAATLIPEDIFDALHAETNVLQAQGWLIPPGSRWIDYTRQLEAFQPEGIKPKRRSQKPVTVARFAIASAVLPSITQAVSVAERLHQTLAKRADRKLCAPVFTGKDFDGNALQGHQHTHIFCELGEKRDSIGFITLFAPAGFNAEAQNVIEEVQRKALWGHGGHDLDLILLGFGEPGTFDIPIFKSSSRWRSLTPFVSTQHLKTYRDGRPKLDASTGWQQGSAAHALLRLLEQDEKTSGKLREHGLRQDKSVQITPEKPLRCLQFQTQRQNGAGQRGNGDAGAFTLEFTEPVSGPLAFGYGSHFGLGLFVPVE